jgi:hypothetical protein
MIHLFSINEWNTKLKSYRGICPSCHKRKKLFIDHIIPISLVKVGHVYTIDDV